MDIVDVRAERDVALDKERTRYAKVLSLADTHFGQDRVSANGRDLASSRYDNIYVDWDKKSGLLNAGIEIQLSSLPSGGCRVDVHNEGLYQQALEFGRKYERAFEKGGVTIRHNFR